MKEYSLYIQKASATSAKNTVDEWSVAVTESCTTIDGGFRDFTSREWADEDGEDVYIPASPKLSAYDAEWKFCYKGNSQTAYSKLVEMRDYLSSGLLSIYDPYISRGFAGAYIKEFGNPEYWRQNGQDILKFSIKFRITKPKTKITATEAEDGTVTLSESSN